MPKLVNTAKFDIYVAKGGRKVCVHPGDSVHLSFHNMSNLGSNGAYLKFAREAEEGVDNVKHRIYAQLEPIEKQDIENLGF